MANSLNSLEKKIDALLAQKKFDADQASELLDEMLELPKSLDRAAAAYRRTLPRSGETSSRHDAPGERFIPPPSVIAARVAKDVYPYLRSYLSSLRDHNNVWLVGVALERIVTGEENDDVEPLTEALQQGLAAYSDQEVADFIQSMTAFEVYDPDKAKRRKAILKKGLPSVLQSRTIPLSTRAKTLLGKLGLPGGTKLPSLPKDVPTDLKEALGLVASVGVKLPKTKGTSPDLPATLRELYGVTSGIDPYVARISELEKLKKSFAKWIKDAEIEEGLPLKFFSPLNALVVFGKSAGGDFFFQDPDKHGDVVFRFIHDEDTLTAEATTLGAFIAVVALEEWADETGVEDMLYKWRDKERKAASKQVRPKKKP